MTSATELLPCPFCGGETHTYKNNLWHVACENANNSCVTMSAFITEAEAIAAWNNRTTHGTLTAEQVREAVMSADRWEKPMGNTGLTNTHLIIRDDGWQAIADELNARAERTCRVEGSYLNDFTSNYECWYEFEMECGYEFMWDEMEPPNYCPNCGAKVRDE